MFTILFFVLEVDILMIARKTGRLRELLWLPVIFALWSNIHIQFIDGLLVLGLALAEALITSRGIGVKTRLRAPWLFAAMGGSILAATVNPFGWHIYRVAYDLASQPGVLDKDQRVFRPCHSAISVTLPSCSWPRRRRPPHWRGTGASRCLSLACWPSPR